MKHYILNLWLLNIYTFLYICKMLISIFSWFFHTIFKDFTEQFYIQNATECTILRPSEKNSIFSWFYHTIFKVLTTQILYPKCSRMHYFASLWIFFSGGADSSPTAFSLSRVGMYRNVTYMIWWWVKIKGLLSSIIASDIFGHYIVFCESLKRFINKYVKWQYTNFIFKQFLMQ